MDAPVWAVPLIAAKAPVAVVSEGYVASTPTEPLTVIWATEIPAINIKVTMVSKSVFMM
jgi:hypothetical protein